jgi:hypothetical protein
MTDAEWAACEDPRVLLPHLASHAGTRKQWLFACACCRSVWHLLPDVSREATEAVERYADGASTQDELIALFQGYSEWAALSSLGGAQAAGAVGHLGGRWRWRQTPHWMDLRYIVEGVARSAAEALAKAIPWREARRAQCDLLRDVLRNPADEQAALPPGWPTWNGGIIPSLAAAIYDDRAFDQMTILADALEDAGCADQVLLDHCRGGSEHVRGCWALDALLGTASRG